MSLAPRDPRGWTRADAAHLVRRAGMGAAPGQLDRAVERGLRGFVADLFEEPAHPASLEGGIDHLIGTGSVTTLQSWWAALMLGGAAPLRERMTLLWHDHFATSQDKVGDVRLMLRQNRLLREHALGDFRVLLHEVARDPAMLLWLDGDQNKRGAPNENFAREVMELFALGIGNYDEHDVGEAARAFTGWGTKGRAFQFRRADHDSGSKVVFGERGPFGGDEVIDLILAHPACPRHVARLLLEEFLGSPPDAAQVSRLAAYLVEHDWNIGSTLRHLFESDLFYAQAHRRSRIAGPVELVVGTCRLLGTSLSPKQAAQTLDGMGQALFRPPSVKGWGGGRSWINAGTWLARHNFGVQVAEELDVQTLAVSLGGPARESLLPTLLEHLFPDGVSASYSAALVEALPAEENADATLRRAVALVITSPEHQLV